MRRRKSNRDRQYNGQKKKDQGTNNDLQSEGQTIQWTKEKRPRDKQWSTNRRTNSTMDKRKKTKGQTMIYNTLHRKLKIEQHETH